MKKIKLDKSMTRFSDITTARQNVIVCAKAYYNVFSFADGTFDSINEEKLSKKTDDLIYAVEELLKLENRR